VKAKTAVTLGLRVAILTLLLFALLSMDFVRLRVTESAWTARLALLIVSFLDILVLSYPILRSRWTGWRLVAATFLVLYGVMTFLSQIETVVFLQYLVEIVPAEQIPGLFLNGAITAAIFSPLAVLIHGRMREVKEEQQPDQRLVMSWTRWLWKLILVAVSYLVIYICFGMFVFLPLAGEAGQEYYADLQLPVWILPFQLLRGLIWAALALPVIRMMKGRWWEAGLAVSLLFSVLMGALLLVPTEFMPDAVRFAHLVEVSSSNFLFGWIVALALALPSRTAA